MKHLLIMNPGSHGGTSQRRFQQIFDLLKRHKIDFDYQITGLLDDAYRLSVEGNKSGFDVIIAVGGDGTINRVLNGFFDDAGRRISGAKMGVIYTGTSPDFCKSYRIPVRTKTALQIIARHNSRPIRIGKIDFMAEYDRFLDNQPLPEGGAPRTGYFACCANVGIGAALASAANSGIRRICGDRLGTFLALLKLLSVYQPGRFMARIDGDIVSWENLFNLSMGKTRHIASGIKVRHQLRADDERFYRLSVKELNPLNCLSVLKTIYAGKEFGANRQVSLEYGRKIEIFGNRQNPEIEFDGDPQGFLPCRIETAIDVLDLICEVENGTGD